MGDHAGLWVERARVPGVDDLVVEECEGIVGVQCLFCVMDEVAHAIVAGIDIVHGATRAGDAALVGDDDDAVASVFERMECFDDAGEEQRELRLEQVAPLDILPSRVREIGVAVDGVIAIEEDRGAWGIVWHVMMIGLWNWRY